MFLCGGPDTLLDALSEEDFAEVEILREAFMAACKDSGLIHMLGQVSVPGTLEPEHPTASHTAHDVLTGGP